MPQPQDIIKTGPFGSQSTNNVLKKVGNNIDGFFTDAGNAVGDTLRDVFNPADARRGAAGLPSGGETRRISGDVSNVLSKAKFVEDDWRVRLSLPPGNNLFYKKDENTLLAPLKETNGMIWPYTPQIMLSHSAAYGGQNATHSNYTQYFYNNSTVDNITIAGEFTAQNQYEARYVISVLHFLRTVTKMFFGRDGDLAGTPPPVLRLNGYGDFVFSSVPVVVVNFTFEFAGDVDYINAFPSITEKSVGQGIGRPGDDVSFSTTTISTRVPTRSSVSVSLVPIYSRKAMRDFGLQEFSNGSLIKKGNRGGFI